MHGKLQDLEAKESKMSAPCGWVTSGINRKRTPRHLDFPSASAQASPRHQPSKSIVVSVFSWSGTKMIPKRLPPTYKRHVNIIKASMPQNQDKEMQAPGRFFTPETMGPVTRRLGSSPESLKTFQIPSEPSESQPSPLLLTEPGCLM